MLQADILDDFSKKELKLIDSVQQNEKFFVEVLIAMMNTDNPTVIIQITRVIFYYSKTISEFGKFLADFKELNTDLVTCRCPEQKHTYTTIRFQKCFSCLAENIVLQSRAKIINPLTVVWLLKILSRQSRQMTPVNQELCCMCSLTLLSIVDNNDMVIDYQDQAIIKLFNIVLQNIEVFAHEVDRSAATPIGVGSPDADFTFIKSDIDLNKY